MTRPDEIAALADAIEFYRNMSDETVYSGQHVANILQHWTDRLSATSPGDAVLEALKPFAKMSRAMFVSGHCGGASPEDWPGKWIVDIVGGPDGLTPNQCGGVLCVEDFRRAHAALAPAEKAGDDAVELAYGLLWLVGCDRSTPNGNALYLARKALYEKLDKAGQARGITAARQAVNDNPYIGGSDGARSFDHILDAGDGVCGRISADAVDEPCGRSGDTRAVTGAGHHVASVDSAASTDTAGIQSAAGLDATPTPPSADVAKARVHADRIRWLLDNQPNALSFACEMHARARSIMESLDTLIQSAAPGGGHQSDGGDLSALPSGECEPVVTQAYPPSDPAQEPEAVALKPCPFCGSSDSFAERYDYSSTYVKCNNCSAHGPTELQEDDREETLGEEFAKRAWNTRPVSLDREALIRWVQSKDPANIGRKTGSQWADEILALIGGRT